MSWFIRLNEEIIYSPKIVDYLFVKTDKPWYNWPGHVVQSVARLTREPEPPGSIPGPATYFRFCFH